MTTDTRPGLRLVSQPNAIERILALASESKAEWANGCAGCEFGLVKSMPLTGAVPMYEERAMQAGMGQLGFCTCRAGHMYRQNLRRIYGAWTLEQRASLRARLEEAQDLLIAKDAVDAPTVHKEAA